VQVARGRKASRSQRREPAAEAGFAGREPPAVRDARYRWLILGAGTLSATSLSAVQIGISSIAPALRSDFDLSLGDIGVVLGATNAGMTLTLLAWGIVSDRIGERLSIVIGLGGAALALAAAATVHSFAALVVALVATGAFGASVNSASGRAVMHWFAPDERGLALGIRQAAIPIGGFAGAVALPTLVSSGGVHAAFVALAVNALVWAVLAGVVLRERHVDEEIAEQFASPLRDLRMWLLCSASALVLAGQLAIMSFVVLFLHDVRGFSTAHAAIVLAVVQVGAIAVRIAVGRRSDRERHRVPLFRRLSAALALVLALAAALVHGPIVLLIPLLVLAGVFGMSWNGLSFTAAAEAAGPRRSGAAIGFQQTVLGVGGIVIPIAFAAVVDGSSWRIAFFASATCALLGAALLRPLVDL
jgi:sugar phosphate permease